MSLKQRLDLRQGQGLVITPQLQQAIKLLTLSNLELEAVIEAEIERNPLLAREEGDGGLESLSESDGHDSLESRDTASGEIELSDADQVRANAEIDVSNDDLYGEDAPSLREPTKDHAESSEGPQIDWSKAGKGGGGNGFDEDGLERTLSVEKSLSEHLTDQALIAGFSPSELMIAQNLIDAVDEAGYCRADLGEIAERLSCEISLVESVLTTCQGFEPTGIMATSVPECLKLQLMERNRYDPAMALLIDNLELLARRDLATLRKLCGVDDEDLAEMIAELKALTPRPGATFGAEMTHTVIPDVFVRADVFVKLASSQSLVAHATGNDAHMAFDGLMDHIEKRIRRYKRRLKNHHKPERSELSAMTVLRATDDHEDAHFDDKSDGHGPPQAMVIAETETALKTMTVSAAVLELDLSHYPVIVFRNAGHGGLSVVYRRPDGNIGWIDPERTTPKSLSKANGQALSH